ncbi:MAG: nicotinamidase-related amidase [Bradymonadia bacterium]|jgi:nicotinamidase-related amidase
MSNAVLPRVSSASLLIIDVQERLFSVIQQQQSISRYIPVLLEAAEVCGWPTHYCEQYPKGLGATDADILAALGRVNAVRHEKLAFSALQEPGVTEALLKALKPDVIVCGIETHVCVLQTVADLQGRGHQCFVPRDAVGSRTSENYENGLALCERAGAVIVNTESLVFSALKRAGTPEFKRLSKLLR